MSTWSGNDSANTRTGSAYADTIQGNGGNDTLYGNGGNDTYIYNYDPTYHAPDPGNDPVYPGDGIDVVYDNAGNDTLRINGISPSHLSYESSGKDLIVHLHGAGESLSSVNPDNDPDDQIILKNWFVADKYRVENIVCEENGFTESVDEEYILFQDGVKIVGTDNDDTINGTAYMDFIECTKGQDEIYGGAGDDIYHYGAGVGQSIITDTSGNDTIRLSSYFTEQDVKFSRMDKDLAVYVKDSAFPTNFKIGPRVKDWFLNNNNRVENVEIEGSSVSWNLSEILANITSYSGNSSTNNNDKFTGTSLNESFQGFGGNDTLSGGAGNDDFHGGTGNDKLYGGSGNDQYYYSAGDGIDIISDTSGEDLLECSSIVSGSMTFTKSGNNLVAGIDLSNKITILNYFSGAGNKIESFQFSNQTLHTDDIINQFATATANTMRASNYNDSIIGLGGKDTLYGYAGNDTYYIGAGHGTDYIYDSSGSDNINFGYDYNYNIVSVKKFGYDLVVNQLDLVGESTGDGAVVKNYFSSANSRIEEIRTTSSGSIATNKSIIIADMKLGTSGNNNLSGGTEDNFYFGNGGRDTISDTAGNDSYYIKAGNSLITDAGAGNDFYHYYAGSGNDTISDAGGYDEVLFYNVDPTGGFNCDIIDYDLKITISSNNTLTFKNWYTNSDYRINTFKFYYGNNGSNEQTFDGSFATNSSIRTVEGDSGNNAITFDGGQILAGYDECIISGDGNDTIEGHDGNDKVWDKSGNDLYQFALGDGHDTITDLSGNDTLQFDNGITLNNLDFSKIGNDMLVQYGSDDITIKNWFASADNKIEGAIFNGSYNYIESRIFVGTTGKDTLVGSDYDDHLYAHNGNDSLFGGTGNDVYSFGLGDGHDTITDTDQYGNDTLRFTDGITIDDLEFTKSGNNMFVQYGSDDITIKNWFASADNKIEGAIFNGSYDYIESQIFAGTTGTDILLGSEYSDYFYGQAGNDSLTGDTGNDIYNFSSGDGHDTITDTAGNDEIHFKSNVVKSKIALFLDGSNNLIIDYGTTAGTNRITVESQNINTIERVELSNGEFLTANTINHVISDMNVYVSAHSGTAYSSVNNVKSNAELMNIIFTHWQST